jgi:hypothetical protein
VDGDRLQWIACISAPLEIARRHINEEILANTTLSRWSVFGQLTAVAGRCTLHGDEDRRLEMLCFLLVPHTAFGTHCSLSF